MVVLYHIYERKSTINIKNSEFTPPHGIDRTMGGLIEYRMFAGLESDDVMREHQATKSPECSTEEGFAITSPFFAA